jgi:hypothetical protein
MPRELLKTFSKARIRRGRKGFRIMKTENNKMDKAPGFIRLRQNTLQLVAGSFIIVLSMAILSLGNLSTTPSLEDFKESQRCSTETELYVLWITYPKKE